jgi:hypothetical protein
MIPIGDWAPDQALIGSGLSLDIKNALPFGNSYGPASTLATITSGLGLTVLGAFQARRIDGSYAVFAATQKQIWLYNQAGDSWSDVSRTLASPYNGPPDGEYWWFVQSGDDVLAGNLNDVPQRFILSSSSSFAILGGSPPTAGAAAIVHDLVVLSRLDGDPYTIKWQGSTGVTSWTPGTDNAGVQTFKDGGQVLGVSGLETGLVLQQSTVRQMAFQASGPATFAFQKIENAKGCDAPFSIIPVAGVTFYHSDDGWRAIDGGMTSRNIGLDRVNEWFKTYCQTSKIKAVVGAIDPRRTRVAWAFCSTDAPQGVVFDHILVYDWGRNKFGHATCSLDYLAFNGLATLGYTLDQLDIFGTVDSIGTSFDSSVWVGGSPTFGGFSSDHELGFFNGAPQEAVIETAETQLNPPGRAFVESVVVYGAPDEALVSVAGRERALDNENAVYGPEYGVQDDGVWPSRASARYHRIKIRVPEGTSWPQGQIQGYDLNFVPEGGR